MRSNSFILIIEHEERGFAMNYTVIMTLLVFLVLIYSTAKDIRYHEIPIELFLFLVVPLGAFGQILQVGPGLFEVITMTLITALCYLILACFFGGGGGDVIMMIALAACLGNGIIIVMAVATILLTLYRVLGGQEPKAPVPYAPFVIVGFVIERMIYFK